MMLAESFIDLPGVRLHYRWDGAEDKPVLVLSHSLGAAISLWEPQLPDFSRSFHVLRYDARGHGQSSIPPGPYTIDQLGGDVVGLLDALGIQTASFCGISMGGAVGQWLGVHARERLHKLVLSNTAAKIGDAQGWDARIATVLADGVAPIVPGQLDRWFTPGFHKSAPGSVERAGEMLASCDAAGYAANCAALREMDQSETIKEITTPTLLIAGTYDPATTVAQMTYLADNIAGSQYVEFPVAHLSNVEAASQFNETVLRFLLE
jgi:3-oxoadipate enol-lactonase